MVLTWPTLRDPASTIPQDTGDPTLQAWQVAWGGHALLTNPFQVWHSNTFYPEPYTYAYSDTLLGYAPFGMIGDGPVAAVVRYNLLYVLTHALALFGAYALARQVGAGRAGAAVAGVSFAYAPWKLAQAGHLHVLSIGGIALALAMLARGHGWSLRHGHRPDRGRPGWVVAGWAVAAWQVTLGFGIGLPFAYALGSALPRQCGDVRRGLVAAAGPAGGAAPPAPGRPGRRDRIRRGDPGDGRAVLRGGGPQPVRPAHGGPDRDVLPAVAGVRHRAAGVLAVGGAARGRPRHARLPGGDDPAARGGAAVAGDGRALLLRVAVAAPADAGRRGAGQRGARGGHHVRW